MYLKSLHSWSQQWMLLLFSHNTLHIPLQGANCGHWLLKCGKNKVLEKFHEHEGQKIVSLEYYILIAKNFVLRLKEQED